MESKEWFADWFSSPYYPLLYRKRGRNEAQVFLQHLLAYLALPLNTSILDLACGSGRYAILLAEMGYPVVGVDLSEKQINIAKNFVNRNLKFYVEDMRKLNFDNEFGLILNLFTSFGYFNDINDNIQCLRGVVRALAQPNGIFVLDYLNTYKTTKNLIENEVLNIENIHFKIQRKLLPNFIQKNIQVIEGEKTFRFQEQVQCFTLEDFEALFEQVGLKIFERWGGYEGQKFELEYSERLILFAQLKV